MRLSTINWNYSHISGWLVAPGPSERCMITESVQWPNLNPIDAINSLVKWVEEGVAPETIIATKFVNDTPPTVQMTRPLCVFPKVAKYMGSGEGDVATVTDDLSADLDQLIFEARQRPIFDRLWRPERAEEVAEIVGERMKLETDGVGSETAA